MGKTRPTNLGTNYLELMWDTFFGSEWVNTPQKKRHNQTENSARLHFIEGNSNYLIPRAWDCSSTVVALSILSISGVWVGSRAAHVRSLRKQHGAPLP